MYRDGIWKLYDLVRENKEGDHYYENIPLYKEARCLKEIFSDVETREATASVAIAKFLWYFYQDSIKGLNSIADEYGLPK